MTTAQTTVIVSDFRNVAVYFGRRLAYVIQDLTPELYEDIRSLTMAPCGGQGKYKKKATT